jgi:uncharacterized protein
MKIKISHLPAGVHEFESRMNRDVFNLEATTIFRDPIEIKVVLQKFQQSLVVDLNLNTSVHYFCDRCLEEFKTGLKTNDRITFSTNQDLTHDSEDEIRELGRNAIEIDLTADIREILLLAIPAKAVCKENCAGLCAGCGANLNKEACHCQKSGVDPRWDELKKLTN